MISSKWVKLIKSLHLKKFRKAEQLFFVEGEKSVVEVLTSGWNVSALFATAHFMQQHQVAASAAKLVQLCSSDELIKVGTFHSNDAALAVVRIPTWPPFSVDTTQWSLVLDSINDPGNLGSIIRIADWYGIQHIICSPDTTDCYNPKVIAAAKGSFLRVQLHYQPLLTLLENTSTPVYGAFLDGHSVHQLTSIPTSGFIVLGNEANGISDVIAQQVTDRITIPAFGMAESLNVSIAAAVICDNLKRLTASR